MSRCSSSSRPRDSRASGSAIPIWSISCRRRTWCSRPACCKPSEERVFLRVSGAFESEDDIRKVNLLVGERLIPLLDIAGVRRGYSDPPLPLLHVNGRPAIGLAIAMREGGDILALGRQLKAEIAAIRADLPLGIEPFLVSDQAFIVANSINDFTTSLWQAVVIILAVSFVSLGMRPGSVVALTIPLIMAIVFAVMNIFAIDLQRISLGALIIALGLLVDDAMTTVDAMLRRLAAGDSKEAAATFAYKTLAAPMLAGTLITIAGFVPIGFARSAASEYTFSIFAVVTIALLASWLVAVTCAPVLGMAILKPPKATAVDAPPGRIARAYTGLLVAAMRWKWATIALALAAFVASGYLLRFVPNQFFPTSDRLELVVDVTLRQNASIYASEEVAKRLDAVLAKDADVAHWSTYVGRGAVRFYLPLNVQLADPFFAQAVIVTKGFEERQRVQGRLEKLLAEEFPGRGVAHLAARAGATDRLAGAVPGERAEPGRGEPDRPAGCTGRGRQPQRTADQLRLDGAGAPAAREDRPGPGAPERSQLDRNRSGAARRDHRLHRHAGARRHLSGRRSRARASARNAHPSRRCVRCKFRPPAVATWP